MAQLYKHIASTLSAIRSCERTGNTEWLERHKATLAGFLTRLPNGAGFDTGTSLDIDDTGEKRLVFRTSFHHMNDSGMYDGWTEHTVVVTPSFEFDFHIRVTGRNRSDIKDYIADTFQAVLSEDISDEEYRQVAA